MTESLPPGGAVLDADELEARWRNTWQPEQVAGRLSDVDTPWCIAAGWALDLFAESNRDFTASGQFLFDVFREPHEGDTWICRRDPRLRLPYDAIIERTTDGIPYLVPELVLLFKAKAVRAPRIRRTSTARCRCWIERAEADSACGWSTYTPDIRGWPSWRGRRIALVAWFFEGTALHSDEGR